MKFFNTNKWICNTSNNKKFIKLLNYDGFKHQKENENIIVIVENENKFDQLQKKLTKNNIYFTLLVKCTPTLQDIYDKLIIKGSVDTM
jgi:hypothetical protein